MQNFMGLYMKKFLDCKALTFGVKTNLGQFGPKAIGKELIKSLVENLAPILTNRTSFS